ncbi:MAG: transporter substrate-binding domain-containing protein [Sphaerochaetaceae bacterium]|nr:transporter substrate-binding domain-containing protein [Sphaerochaetaceae bacterium]
MKKALLIFMIAVLLCTGVFAATDTSSFKTLEDFNGLPIGVQTAVLYEELMMDKVPDTEFQYYTMPTDMIQALKSGKIAAYLVEGVGYYVHKANHPELDTFVEIPGYISASNIIGNNERTERLLSEMNEFIAKGYENGLLGDDGELYQYWIADFDPETDTRGVKDFTFTGENGTLNIAVEGGYEPFSFVSDGNLAGFDVEFICRFCAEYGYTPIFNEIPFEAIAPGVETGKFDIGMNIVVSEERNETGTLSDVYYTCPVFLVVLAPENTTRTGSFDTIEDFDGLPIGVQTAVLYEELIMDRVPNTTFQYYTMPTDMIQALKSGKIAAYLVEGVGYYVHKANHPELETFKEIPGYISASNIIGNNERTERLLSEMNEFIANGYENGLLGDDGELYQYWIADFDPETDTKGVNDFTFTGENGTLNIAVEGGYEPFSFVSDGNLAGFDVEFICRFCAEYGYTPIFNEIPFEAIAPGVETGKFDIGMNIVVSEERNETGTLSDVYYTCPVFLVVLGEEIQGTGFLNKIENSFYKTFIKENRWKLFVQGAGVTILITICSIIAGTILGFGVYMLCRHGNKIANRITNFVMWLIHGMPTVLLLMILYYIVFGKSRMSGTWVSVVGFSLMFMCSMIEMLRVGYNAIGRGQYEASTALGYSDKQSFFKILLPQAANHFLPLYSNEVVTLIKETSVVGYIAVLDLTKISDLVRSRTYEAFFALILTAVIYFIIAEVLIRVVRAIQKRIDPKRRSEEKILSGIKQWD